MKIKDYHLAVAILRCLEHSEREFGKEYSTSTTRVKKNDLVDLATYVKETNQNRQHKGENRKLAHAGPNKDTEAKNHSGGRLWHLLASFPLELVGILQLTFDKYCVDRSDIR